MEDEVPNDRILTFNRTGSNTDLDFVFFFAILSN